MPSRGAGAVLVALVLAGCRPAGEQPSWPATKAGIRERFADVAHLSIEQFETMRTARTLVVDVRTPEEFRVSHLLDAVNIDDPETIARLARDRDADAVVLYCSVGYRSAAAARRLAARSRGAPFAVYNLEGSIFEWANGGRPVFGEDGAARTVHPYDAYWGRLLEPALHAR